MIIKTWQPTTYAICEIVLRGELIAIQTYLKKNEEHQINNLILNLKQLEKEQTNKQTKSPKLVEGKKS